MEAALMPARSDAPTERYLAPLSVVPAGEGRRFRVGARDITIFHQRNGTLFAVESGCPHQGGPLADGIIGADTVICPFHGWRFNLQSGACLNDPSHCIQTFSIREDRGWIVISV